MTKEQMAIVAAHGRVVQHLDKMRDAFLKDCDENPDTYKDLDIDDAYVWFIESF